LGTTENRLTSAGNNFNGYVAGWDSIFSGANANTWRCIEVHFKRETSGGAGDGVYQLWVDGTSFANVTNVTFGTTTAGFYGFTIPGNGVWTTGGTVDHDDLAISQTERIGCGS
jgi:hypothetical protein